MTNKDQESPLRIGGTVFCVCWIACLVLLAVLFVCDIGTVKSAPGFLIIMAFIGILMFPFIRSFSVGNVFSVQVRELTNSVERLQDSVQNLISFQFRSTQNVVVSNLNAPDGRNIKIETEAKSKRYSEQANSLFGQGRYLEAIEYYEKAFEWDPNNWVAAFYLGFLYLSLRELNDDENSWGFSENERLLRSAFYSTYATKKDPNHYMQFMNLGIALRHIGGERLIKLGLQNLEKAYNMLSHDPQVPNNPNLMLAKGKCRSFMGEFADLLGMREEAALYRREAVEIFGMCPAPVPDELHNWLQDAERALMELERNG